MACQAIFSSATVASVTTPPAAAHDSAPPTRYADPRQAAAATPAQASLMARSSPTAISNLRRAASSPPATRTSRLISAWFTGALLHATTRTDPSPPAQPSAQAARTDRRSAPRVRPDPSSAPCSRQAQKLRTDPAGNLIRKQTVTGHPLPATNAQQLDQRAHQKYLFPRDLLGLRRRSSTSSSSSRLIGLVFGFDQVVQTVLLHQFGVQPSPVTAIGDAKIRQDRTTRSTRSSGPPSGRCHTETCGTESKDARPPTRSPDQSSQAATSATSTTPPERADKAPPQIHGSPHLQRWPVVPDRRAHRPAPPANQSDSPRPHRRVHNEPRSG